MLVRSQDGLRFLDVFAVEAKKTPTGYGIVGYERPPFNLENGMFLASFHTLAKTIMVMDKLTKAKNLENLGDFQQFVDLTEYDNSES